MTSEPEEDELSALIRLHGSQDRQGPGDLVFSKQMLSMLPALTKPPRIADLGCGAGAAALMLAEHFQAPVASVDYCRPFLDRLSKLAKARGIDRFIRPMQGDIGNLPWPASSLDLIWSEGAAYNLTFA